MKMNKILLVLILLIVFAIAIQPSFAATHTVVSGMDNGDIADVINSSQAGDIINFEKSTYNDINLTFNGKKDITFFGNDSTLVGTGKSGVINLGNSDGIKILNFTIIINSIEENGIYGPNVKNSEIDNNIIKNGGDAINLYASSSGNTITNNKIQNVTTSWGDGISVINHAKEMDMSTLAPTIIKNNYIEDVNFGIFIGGNFRGIIDNNTVINATEAAMETIGKRAGSNGIINMTLTNNKFENADNDIGINFKSPNVMYLNISDNVINAKTDAITTNEYFNNESRTNPVVILKDNTFSPDANVSKHLKDLAFASDNKFTVDSSMDKETIQRILDVCNDGYEVNFKPGDYIDMSLKVKKGIHLIGNGANIIADPAGSVKNVIDVTGTNGTKIEGFNININNFSCNGISGANVLNAWIENNTIINGGDGINLYASTMGSIIKQNTIRNMTEKWGDGISVVNHGKGVDINNILETIITDNTIEDVYHGIFVGGNFKGNISSNVIKNATINGIEMTGKRAATNGIFLGNITDNSIESTGSALYLNHPGVDYLNLMNNKLDGDVKDIETTENFNVNQPNNFTDGRNILFFNNTIAINDKKEPLKVDENFIDDVNSVVKFSGNDTNLKPFNTTVTINYPDNSASKVYYTANVNSVPTVNSSVWENGDVISVTDNVTYIFFASDGKGNFCQLGYKTFTIDKYSTKLFTNDTYLSFGVSGNSFDAILKDQYGNVLAGMPIIFTVGNKNWDKPYPVVTDEHGIASLPINLAKGKYFIYSTFNGNDLYLDALNLDDIFVYANNTPILNANEDCYYGYNHPNKSFDVLLNYIGNPLINKTVNVHVFAKNWNKSYSVRTDEHGIASLPINLAIGDYTINSSFAGDENYFASNKFVSSVKVVDDKLPILKTNDLVTTKGASSFVASLTDFVGNPLDGRKLSLHVFAKGGDKAYNFTTDENGMAALPINLAIGDYTINSSFAGDKDFKPVSAYNTVKVVDGKLPILKTNDLVTRKGVSSFTAILNDYKGNPIAKKNVSIQIIAKYWNKTYDLKTDANGEAALPINLNPGTYTVKTLFAGDAQYKSVSATNSLKVYDKYPLNLATSNLVVTYGKTTNFVAKLTNETGKTLVNYPVGIKVIAKNWNKVYTVKTNSKGEAILPIRLAVGTYTLETTYQGSTDYAKVSKTNTVTVRR